MMISGFCAAPSAGSPECRTVTTMRGTRGLPRIALYLHLIALCLSLCLSPGGSPGPPSAASLESDTVTSESWLFITSSAPNVPNPYNCTCFRICSRILRREKIIPRLDRGGRSGGSALQSKSISVNKPALDLALPS